MSLSKKKLKNSVRKLIDKEIMEEILSFFEDKDCHLWGIEQPHDYKEINIYLTIYKYKEYIGYYSLWEKIKVWFHNSHHSLQQNFEIILQFLKLWAKYQITTGTLDDWKFAARNVPKPKELSGVCLWMDSTDFAFVGKKPKYRKSNYWSFKTESLGYRYQVVFDGLGRIVKIWGGYFPKTADNIWIDLHKEELSEIFKGANLVADCGYYASRNHVEGVKFTVPVPATVKTKKTGKKKEIYLTKDQLKKNISIRRLRARVEIPFGKIAKKFRSLREPFNEGHKKMDCLVYFIAAIINKSLIF